MNKLPLENPDMPDPETGGRLQAAVGALTWPARKAWWTLEEKVLWRSGDVARNLADGAAGPAEHVAWNVRRRVIWPVADLFDARGRTGRVGIASTLAVAAAAAAFAGVQLSSEKTPEALPSVQVAQRTLPLPQAPELLIAPAPLEAEDPGPVLRGAAPSFEPPETDDSSQSATGTADDGATPVDVPAAAEPEADESTDSGESAGDEAETIENVDVPLRVARRFAKAFVLYEVGEDVEEARGVFRETAAPDLARALADRPPRQPADVEVPKAKVVNLVPGPNEDAESLAVSVSLLRLGATSELRLDLELEDDGEWLVGDVRG